VPGEITSALSAGTNAPLRLGATAATCAADVLESFGLAAPATPEPPPQAKPVLERLPATADELCRALGLDAGALAALLAELELAGLVTEAEGVYRSSR
jgi:predicted Rossmann fold nucleotide-binding protein DprA/Smf involved in DNA uptake